MALSTRYLAVDLGAESGRATLGALDQGRLTLEEIHRFPNRPVCLPDGLHWNVLQLWSEIQDAIARAVHARKADIAGIGVDTWGVDFALIDRQGELLQNPYHYRDSRTDGMVEEAFRRITPEALFEQTGLQVIQLNTLYQLLSMVVRGSPVLEAAQTLLTMPDLINYWLSGTITSEFTNATTTQCFNPRQRDWAWSVLDQTGIPRRLFTSVSEPGTMIGSLRAQVAKDLDAQPFPVILPACHDTGSAVVAVPAQGAGFAWISSGTWSIMGVETRQPVITEKMRAYNFTNEGGVFGTWRISKNIMGLWLIQECRRAWAQQGGDFDYSTITKLAEEAKPFLAVIDPDDSLFFRSGSMPERICDYCRRTSQAVPQTEGEIARVILESIALKYRLTLERLEVIMGARLEPVHIIGGGSRNNLLNQFTADATRRPVIAGPEEATTVGNILMQAIAKGALNNLEDARDVVRNSFTPQLFMPSPTERWDEAYERLKNLIQGI